MIDPIDVGGAVLVETTFKYRNPHGSADFYDPSSITISVYDPSSTLVITSQAMSATNANSTGLYHSIIQTSTSWTKGKYETKISAYDGAYREISVAPRIFELE